MYVGRGNGSAIVNVRIYIQRGLKEADWRVLRHVRTYGIDISWLHNGVYGEWAPIRSSFAKSKWHHFAFRRVFCDEWSWFLFGDKGQDLLGFLSVDRDVIFSEIGWIYRCCTMLSLSPKFSIYGHHHQCWASFSPRMPFNLSDRRCRVGSMIELANLYGPIQCQYVGGSWMICTHLQSIVSGTRQR